MSRPALRCEKCGLVVQPEAGSSSLARDGHGRQLVAKPGGTHYVVHRREGVVGMRGATRAVSCGTWRSQQPEEGKAV